MTLIRLVCLLDGAKVGGGGGGNRRGGGVEECVKVGCMCVWVGGGGRE